ncbi:MAG TPA: hypothetical protein VID31_03760 [Streptosporangiaceae bacterium]
MATRKAGARLGQLATVLAAVIVGLLASAAAVPAAFAGTDPIPDPAGYIGDPYIGTSPVAPVPATTVRVITAGGLAGWQITLIVLGAALAAAAAAVLLDRKLAGRHRAATTA